MWEVALLILAIGIAGSLSNRRKIKKLHEELVKLEVNPCIFEFSEEMSEGNAIAQLEWRIDNLKSCYRCPMYQARVRQGKSQSTEGEQKEGR